MTGTPITIAITGLRTVLGARLTERLLTRPAVTVVGIDRQRPWGLPATVRFHDLDLTRPDADLEVAEVLRKEEVQALVHLAFRREPTRDLEADHLLEVGGSRAVLEACGAAGVGRVVLASTTMAYGARPDNPNYLTEEHPLRGHPSASPVQNRVEVEGLAREWSEEGDRRLTVLRPCWMVGPDTRDPVARYLGRAVVPVPMGYDPLVQLVHEQDCLRAFERASLESIPGVFNIVGQGVRPLSRLLRHAGKRPLPIPGPLLPRFRRAGDPPEWFDDYLRYLWVADGRKGFDAFGEPDYTTGEAFTAFATASKLREAR